MRAVREPDSKLIIFYSAGGQGVRAIKEIEGLLKYQKSTSSINSRLTIGPNICIVDHLPNFQKNVLFCLNYIGTEYIIVK